jgi:hypothetical protein
MCPGRWLKSREQSPAADLPLQFLPLFAVTVYAESATDGKPLLANADA